VPASGLYGGLKPLLLLVTQWTGGGVLSPTGHFPDRVMDRARRNEAVHVGRPHRQPPGCKPAAPETPLVDPASGWSRDGPRVARQPETRSGTVRGPGQRQSVLCEKWDCVVMCARVIAGGIDAGA